MEASTIGILGFVIALLLILVRVPVAIAMGLVGAIGFGIINGFDSVAFVMGAAPFESVFPYTLSVVPLFLMMGVFASHAGLSSSLFRGVNAFVGHFKGGLAMASIGACAGFGAICGSSLATAATMCRVTLPEMRRHGYDDSLSSAAIAAGGTLGVLIPPSILLVIYGLLTEQSIGRLFAAALIPGLLATLLYMGAVAVQVRRNPELGPAARKYSWSERFETLREIRAVVGLFALVIGGIYIGLFSPTEAAAVGAFGAIVMAVARKAITKSVFWECMRETAQMTGMIFLILIGAAVFNYFIETTNLPQLLISAVGEAGLSPITVLLLLMVFYIILGCFMDALSMILLTVPFVFPLISALGLDPIWFGVLLVTVAELGLITPPVGMNLFIIQGVAGNMRLETVAKGVVPFLIADIIRLAILILIPGLVLWLPSITAF